MKALVIEDTLTTLTVVCQQLERMGIVPISARDCAAGLKLFEEHRPDIVLLDIILPGMDGLEVARQIRTMEAGTEWTPIIFLSARTSDDDVSQGIAAGGDDYLTKPVSMSVIGAKVRAMQRIAQMRYSLLVLTRRLNEANQELQRLSAVDGLTGIANRRHFDQTLEREWRRCLRAAQPLSLILFDIDCFKQYNDALGHQAGDECLRTVAAALGAQLRRPADMVARYGGEEFVAVLPETDLKGAMMLAEKMRRAVEFMAISHPCSVAGSNVTVSAGAANALPSRDSNPAALLEMADAALYDAKRGGRNSVCSRTAAALDPSGTEED
ncbi:MAG: diguanylate cyclase [Betaproteobacteria bacterium]|nr:diguanylate cyclase [Betaproteobacteria bacterium]